MLPMGRFHTCIPPFIRYLAINMITGMDNTAPAASNNKLAGQRSQSNRYTPAHTPMIIPHLASAYQMPA